MVLLRTVAAAGYVFVTPTPVTHEKLLGRRGQDHACSLRDVFGWNLPFAASALPSAVLAAAHQAGVALPCGAVLRSAVRIASLDTDLFLHSPFPTAQADAVFFGPDTYRFARFIRMALAQGELPGGALRVLDVGCGSGAGGIVAVRALARRRGQSGISLILNDINPHALGMAAVNAAFAGIGAALAAGDALAAVDGEFDLIISNPPYMDDAAQRAYRHGGERLGRALSVRIAADALKRLAPGGRLLLYTGVAFVDGADPFLAEVRPLLEAAGCDWSYDEIDPDVFAEELDRPQYAHVERIAAVGLIATRRAGATHAG
jgi:methylase of polypeptide subunit release factors